MARRQLHSIRMLLLLALVIIIIIILVTVAIAILVHRRIIIRHTRPPISITALMVTGKDDERIAYARKSVANFLEQDHPNRTLIIVNHHPTLRVLENYTDDVRHKQVKIKEVIIERPKSMTLGHMRNISLQFVPLKSYWTTWDDDDYRHPHYLSTLAAAISNVESYNTVAVITKRIEYNKNNGSSWVGHKRDGFVFFLAPRDERVIYLDQNTLEDAHILRDMVTKAKFKYKPIDNPPTLYVRLIHSNNTSSYVDPQRDYLRKDAYYSERFTTQKEKEYVESILPKLLL